MASTTDATPFTVQPRSSPYLMKLVTIWDDGDERDVQQADIDTISFQVFEVRNNRVTQILDTGMDPGDSVELVVADVVSDTRFAGDINDEMNFQYQLDGKVYLPHGNRNYNVEFLVTLTGGEEFGLFFEGETTNYLGS